MAVLSIVPTMIEDLGRAELAAIAIAIAVALAATASFFGNLIGAGIVWLACVFIAFFGWWGLDGSMCHFGRSEPPSHLDARGFFGLGVFVVGVVSAGLLTSRSSRRCLMSGMGPLGFAALPRRRLPGRSAARPAARFPAMCILIVAGLSGVLAVPAFLNRHHVTVALLGTSAVAVSVLAIGIRMRGEVVRRVALSLCAVGICGALIYASLREIPPGGFCRYDQYTWSSFFPGPALIIVLVIAMTLLPEVPELAKHEAGSAVHI